MSIRSLRLERNRKKILHALKSEGVQKPESISFLGDDDTSALGKRLHERITRVEETQVESWKEASTIIHEWISEHDDPFLLFDNHWDVGTLVVSSDVVETNMDALYQIIGPDFYCITPDLSHGAVFDKEEYSCFLRMW